MANVVRYVRARETYDAKGLKDNYDLAQSRRAGRARSRKPVRAVKRQQPGQDPAAANTTVSVTVKSVTFPNTRTALVRFQTDEKGLNTSTARHWVGVVAFRYWGATGAQRVAFRQPPRVPGHRVSARPGDGHAERRHHSGPLMKITVHASSSLVLGAIVATCAAGPAWAEQVPRGVQADERIKTVIYRPDDVIGLAASYGISTMVQFGDFEKIETVALGELGRLAGDPEQEGQHALHQAGRAESRDQHERSDRSARLHLRAPGRAGRRARPNLQGPVQLPRGGSGRAPDAGRRATRPVPEPQGSPCTTRTPSTATRAQR